jgi:hypothetical protein
VLDVHFVILGAVIGTVGQAIYARDTLRGRVQPNRVTWLLWAVAPLLAFAVEINEGVGLQALMTFTVGFGPLVIFLVSFAGSSAAWRLGRLDYVCGALSVGGTVGWLVTRQGLVALAAAVAADALAGLPTVLKSWRRPETEGMSVYVGAFVNAMITLFTVTRFTAAELAFPLYIAVLAFFEAVLVAGRIGPRVHAARRHGPDARDEPAGVEA